MSALQNPTPKKVTKKQLITKLNQLTSVYLGFQTGVVGLTSMSKDDLYRHVNLMKRAVAWKKYANKQLEIMKSLYGEQAVLFLGISGEKCLVQDKYRFALTMSHEYWFNNSPIEAYNKARRNMESFL